MTDNDLQTSRRSTLKLVSGAAVGTAGAGTATATQDDQSQEETSSGPSEWMLRLDTNVAGDDISPEEAKLAAKETQRPLVETLEQRDDILVKNRFWLANAVLVESNKSPELAKAELQELGGVRNVHENFEIPEPEPVEEQHLVPEDHGAHTYGLDQINAPDVWKQFDTKGEGVSVAVLDTGIDPDHPALDFDPKNWAFFNGKGQMVDREPFDNNGHGTHVSGTVAGGQAPGLRNKPHIGVAPGVELYNAKVLNNGGTFAQVIAGMQWAVKQNVDVVNMSLGAPGHYDAYIEPVQNMMKQGTLLVSSAGNSGKGTSGSPGNVYETFSIGASDRNRDIIGFSSGELVRTNEDWMAYWLTEDWPINYYVPDVSAPGVGVLSSYPGGEYALLSGTSMASPHTAGAAALLHSVSDGMSNEKIMKMLEMTARHGEGPDANPDERYGKGIIDVLAAATASSDGNKITGTVTDSNGNPVGGTMVKTSFGTEIQTASDGSYELYVGDGEWDVMVDEFGYQQTTETVSVSGGETVTQDLTLKPGLGVSPIAGQPDVVGHGESFEIAVRVANLEALTVSLTDNSALSADSLTVSVGGSELTLGEKFTFDSPLTGKAKLKITVADGAETGSLAFNHTFEGPGEPVSFPTGPSKVMKDPDPASLEITNWRALKEIPTGGVINPIAVIENTGDKTGVGRASWWLGSPQSRNVFPNAVRVKGGQKTRIPFPIRIPAGFERPGTPEKHGWFIGNYQNAGENQKVSTSAKYVGAGYSVTDIDAPSQISKGKTLEVTATVLNFGNKKDRKQIRYVFDNDIISRKMVSVKPGETGTVSFTFDTSQVVEGQYRQTVASSYDAATETVQVGTSKRPPEIAGSRPKDLDGDGHYEDISGNGEFSVQDVQLLFENLDKPALQNHAPAFNFSGTDPSEVTIADVQAQFQMLQEEDGQ